MANVEIMRGQRTVATGRRKGSDEWRNASRVVDLEQKAVLTYTTSEHTHTHPADAIGDLIISANSLPASVRPRWEEPLPPAGMCVEVPNHKA